MLSSSPRPIGRQRRRPTTGIPTICVVDPQAGDYQGWDALADANGVELKLVATAAEALRFSRIHAVELWVINTRLPGLSGCELCGLLKSRDSRTPIYLVADQYAPEVEQAAWQMRATLFGCKGAHGAWLNAWLHARCGGSARCQYSGMSSSSAPHG